MFDRWRKRRDLNGTLTMVGGISTNPSLLLFPGPAAQALRSTQATGEVVFSSGTNNRVSSSGGGMLTIEQGATVQGGGGAVGASGEGLVNQGTIRATGGLLTVTGTNWSTQTAPTGRLARRAVPFQPRAHGPIWARS